MNTNVPHNLKQNIVAGEYIDISLLFVNSMSSSNDSQKITFVEGELIIQPKQSHPKINSIEVWTDAFMVALSVFGSVLPETFHELLKHISKDISIYSPATMFCFKLCGTFVVNSSEPFVTNTGMAY
jgi:hypothetical protein